MSKEKKCQKCTDSHCSYTVSTVPYQLCPKCGGDGIVMVQNWDGSPNFVLVVELQVPVICAVGK
jgi:DnaJ-class molecular chaperone